MDAQGGDFFDDSDGSVFIVDRHDDRFGLPVAESDLESFVDVNFEPPFVTPLGDIIEVELELISA